MGVKLTEEMAKLYEEAEIDTTSFAFMEDGETCKVHTKEMYDKQEKPGIGEIIGELLRP